MVADEVSTEAPGVRPRRVYSQAMLPEIGIGLAAGLVVGWVIAWALGQSRQREEKQRGAQLEQQLEERAKALESAQGERDAARRDLAVQQATAAERDATQRAEIAALKAAQEYLEKNAECAAQALEELRGESVGLHSRLLDSETERASLKSGLEAEQRNHAEKVATLTDQFKSLASEILEKNSKTISEQNKSNIGDLLKPMGDAIEKLRGATQELEVKREGAYEKVSEAIRGIQETHKDLRTETAQLVQALRSPKARGNWGQLQLQRCVEFAGMVEHASFDLEVHVRTDDAALRPDCVVYLPNGRTIIIDAKTPLDAFLDAADEIDETTRALRLAAHAASVRGHVKQLSDKKYWKQFRDSPDFVVCFLPTEALFSAALEQDPELIEFGSNSNVILATPTTLIALLKAVAYGWQQMEITRNAFAIKEAGEKLYDKLATAQKYFSKMGSALDSAVGQYNSLIGCMEGGKGAFVQARRLHELGVGHDELSELRRLESEVRDMKEDEWAQTNGLALAAEADTNSRD